MNFKKSLLFISLASLIPALVFADDIANVTATLHKNYPATQSVSANDVSQAGPLYTFMFSGQRVYTDANADYLLVGGELLARNASGATVNFTPKTESTPAPQASAIPEQINQNVDQFNPVQFTSVIGVTPVKQTASETTLSPAHPDQVWNALPWGKTLTYVYGKGERKVFILEDPDCPICANMEKNLNTLGARLNATISILPIPLPIHAKANSGGMADSYKHNSMLACNGNYAENWREWMAYYGQNILDNTGNPVAPELLWKRWAVSKGWSPDSVGTCPKAEEINKNLDIAKALYISGTPTLIFSDGAVMNGVPADIATLSKSLDDGWNFVATHPVVQPEKAK
jgi:protein-disulfide isomerase